ncbi:MAG: bifunctional diaminohydroxyphosphoribosylaminopyrimidine deaminase/5-amino-6-(5-phosphoribosylamino)uracil reductase RibD [Betaproteobacteria bacterium]|nr:bifunctional diaminohydroxyphosphoribosylaminopyrimidine deaminase/5-amino-6-(5-phosphoribosylamino)uracil reductase RibD [Betaproteobacteria bacterium]MDE2123364.1 bifunctional diaminohydroxyphosphoribosylaminopyrimidine deaminase/5-amino-6-(5-phosphoribosylamino)uracil reductase RibD [Betaproteobacteria bacterium]MDE2187352.1 bifunctional diaminohydroxyphosphoribosylaminopyrimidine deaminase/5-amino-6-(5-phosphoribosylamino)uracil reductase RibD [Betaproteobacteria bacterium]
MHHALRLAEGALYRTSPNPRVGCVIVNHGHVLGEGATEAAGLRHAEIVALDDARDRGHAVRGATVYVTLEPCAHFGRTPPCVDALVAAGVARVVAAARDPNPKVDGGGLARLAAAGIRTECGLLENAARELNLGFFSRFERSRPWVRLKAAASLDGITALPNGQSQWITGPAARADGHHWRARACAVLTGIGTVRDDDPQLTVRHVATPRQPVRVVVDSRLELPPTARLLQVEPHKVWIAHALPLEQAESRARVLRELGAQIIAMPVDAAKPGKTDLHALLRELAAREIGELHVEAGARLNASLLNAGLVDELLLYLAPRLLGQGAGIAPFGPLQAVADGLRLHGLHIEPVGEDWRVRARLG